MDGPEYSDPNCSGEAPTLTGYQDYSARVDTDRALEHEAYAALKANIFRDKPAIVHYDDLHKSEKHLEQLSEGHWHGNGKLQEFWCMERTELPVLDHYKTNEQKLEAVHFVRDHYEKWNDARKSLNEDRAANQETRRRQAAERRQGNWDTAAFWARREVNNHYCTAHEDNNEHLRQQLEAYQLQQREQDIAQQAARMREQAQEPQEPRRRWGFRRDPDIEIDR